MKLNNLFGLVLILTVLFALNAVVASEDVNNGTFSEEALSINSHDSVEVGVDEICKNQDILGDDGSLIEGNGDETDLSVWVDANNVQKGNEFNRAGFTVPWNITAKVNGATAQKVKIKVDLSDNLDYLSHEASVGEFNPETGIWDIGDLESGSSPLLIIMTKIKSDGRFKVTVDGTSDSQDADSSNNNIYLALRSGTDKFGSNVTETTATRNQVSHTAHQASAGGSNHAQRQRDVASSGSNSKKASTDINPISGSNSDAGLSSNSNSVSKAISSDNLISYAINLLNGSPDGTVNPDSNDGSDSKGFSLNQFVASISEYDYTRIPLMIFALFLVILVSIVGYGKVKS